MVFDPDSLDLPEILPSRRNVLSADKPAVFFDTEPPVEDIPYRLDTGSYNSYIMSYDLTDDQDL